MICAMGGELYYLIISYIIISPLIGEEFSFLVPREFNRLSFYVCDGEGVSRDPKICHASFTKGELSLSHEFSSEKWYPLYPISHDSEVQVSVWVIQKDECDSFIVAAGSVYTDYT